MGENLVTVAVIAAVLWLAGYAFYLYTSRQQRDIETDIEQLQQQLNMPEEGSNGQQ